MTSTPPPTDPTRNAALEQAVDDIAKFITARMATYAQTHGHRPDWHLTATDRNALETVGEVADFDQMSDAFGEIVTRWVEDGHLDLDDAEMLEPTTPQPQTPRPS